MSSTRPLSSWKEIAVHLGKGVRTVQRWERELGLPVRRPNACDKHVVIALPEELDRWMRARTLMNRATPRLARPNALHRVSQTPDLERLRRLRQITAERCRELQRRSAEAIERTQALLGRRYNPEGEDEQRR